MDDGSGGAAGMFAAEYMSFGYQGGQAQLTANAPNFIHLDDRIGIAAAGIHRRQETD
ncbi:MAG: hypothetical protein HGA45_17825 [Chloroflexales bacterium]|nr:hypothetical protein [Chloroflexales bacterium]